MGTVNNKEKRSKKEANSKEEFLLNGTIVSGGRASALNFWTFSRGKTNPKPTKVRDLRLYVCNIQKIDQNAIAVGCSGGFLKIFVEQENEVLMKKESKGHRLSIWGMDFSPRKKLLVTSSSDATVKLWKISQEPQEEEFAIDCCHAFITRNWTHVYRVKFMDPVSNLAASCNSNGDLVFHNIEKLKLAQNLEEYHHESICGIDFDRSKKLLISSSKDKNVKALDPRSYKAVMTIPFKNQMKSVLCIRNSHDFIVGDMKFSAKNNMYVIDIRTFKIRKMIENAHGCSITKIKSISDPYILTCSNDRTIKVWNRHFDESLVEMKEENYVNGIAFLGSLSKMKNDALH